MKPTHSTRPTEPDGLEATMEHRRSQPLNTAESVFNRGANHAASTFDKAAVFQTNNTTQKE